MSKDMTVVDMFKVIHENLPYINKLAEAGDSATISMGKLYNLNASYIDPVSLTLFELEFKAWYEANEANLILNSGSGINV